MTQFAYRANEDVTYQDPDGKTRVILAGTEVDDEAIYQSAQGSFTIVDTGAREDSPASPTSRRGDEAAGRDVNAPTEDEGDESTGANA